MAKARDINAGRRSVGDSSQPLKHELFMESLLVRFKPQLDLLPGAARERVEAHIRFRAAHAVPEFVQVVEARKDIEMELAAAEVVRAARSGVPHRKAKKKDLNARVRWTKRERE